MRLATLLLLIVACEKQGPVESTPGSGSSAGGQATRMVKAIDAGVATIGTDAVVEPSPADAAVAVRPDAAVRPADRDSVVMADDALLRYADRLTAEGPADVDQRDMSRRRPGADLGRQLDDVRDAGRTVVTGGGRGTRGDGNARVATGAGPNVDSPGPTPTPVDAPSGHITISSKQAFDESTLLPEVVVAKISAAYMAGLERCYKTYLLKDATARGKINLSLTVNEAGRSVAPRVSGFAGPIDDCIESQMESWRFPIPKDKDGETTDAAFMIVLQLVPD